MRKEEPLPLATPWMDLEGVMLSEISQTERQVLQGIFYLWNRKKKKQKKKPHRNRVEMCLPGDFGWRRRKIESGERGPGPEFSLQIQFLSIMPFGSQKHPPSYPLGTVNKTVLMTKKDFTNAKWIIIKVASQI